MRELDDALDALEDQARILGLPMGTHSEAVSRGVVAMVGTQSIADCMQCDVPATAAVNAVGAGGAAGGDRAGAPRAPRASNCDDCDAFSCDSRNRGGTKKCICRGASAYDVSKLPKGEQRYVCWLRRRLRPLLL